MNKRDLILTIIHGYDYPYIEPFIKSLKEVGYRGDLVIFTSNGISKVTRKALKKSGAILVDYTSEYPFIPEYANAFENIVPDISIPCYRFVFYLNFLLANINKYQNIMLTDVRDVIFQKDPFLNISEEKIYFFLEDQIQTFRSSELNYKWSVNANGVEATATFIDKTVCCAGVTIGGYNVIIEYLKYLKEKFRFRLELPWGLDQGIHNGYIYLTNPPKMHLFSNDEPFVATMGAYQPYTINNKGNVTTHKGEVYAVIHQYDRHGDLLLLIKKKYIGSRLKQIFNRVYYLLMP